MRITDEMLAASTPSLPPPSSTPRPALPARATSTSSQASRVRQQVKRFSTSEATIAPPVQAAPAAGEDRVTPRARSPAVIVGDLAEMDWTPRAARAPGPSSGPVRRAPGAPLSTPAAPAAGKAPAAPTVVVPATVSPVGEGRPRLTIERTEPAVSTIAPPSGEVASEEKVEVGQVEEAEHFEEALAVEPPVDEVAPPPSQRFLHSDALLTTDLPSPPSSPPPKRPILETRRSSVTWAELISPRRESIDLASDSASLLSTASAAPLIPSTSTPRRPPFFRSTSTQRTSATARSVPTAPSSRFTTASGSSTSTRCIYAYELFARDADPLVLPELDAALDALGGAASFSPMPGPGAGGPAGGGRDGKGEEWELESLEKRGEGKGEETVFGSALEREGWERWARGTPPSRWARLVASVRRLVSRQSREAEDERDPLGAAACAAGLSRDEYRRTLKFPPFHLLPTELTVTDLKANRRKPPPLMSLQGLLLTASDGLLGAAGSSMGISLTTVEGLRDLMQMVTLLLTAASPALSTLTVASTSSEQLTARSSTLRILFVTVPSFLSLDFVTAFGQALAFLLVLTLVTLCALYEFFRFTGGWHGPSGALGRGQLDLGEGYDLEDLQERPRRWRDSYAWRIAVTFWCGSLYLPLSKLAIGALVWSDDFWAVTNPYELFGVDDPAPPPLGPQTEYYDSMDFCWRTTMRRRNGATNLNFAYALVPVAAVVLALLALWFPWRMWNVVKREAPRVDGWTELGERRRDPDAEYERLLDVDPSPFNFLYRGALVFKLVNVLLVVLIQKNNCVFRSYGETYLSVVRQGSLLTFMALFCLASALSSPYLTRISNSSDIVSRVGYVFLSLLGLLAALSLPGTDPAVITTNVVVYGLNIYFTVIGLGVSQGVVKKLQRRLDASIDIFSPQLDLAKHLSRRVWQESLAALLLCSPKLAMQATQKLQFSQDKDLPPYLLNFKGSPAERFVENLKILREIGLDAYSDAIRYRQLSPDSRIMRLRRLIQLQHTGPDIYYRPVNLALPVTSYFGRVDVVPFPFIVVFRYDQQPTQPLHLVEIEDLELLVKQNRAAEVAAARKVRLALRALEDQVVFAPHVEIHRLGASGGADVERHVAYRLATLRIKRNSSFLWRGYNCSSGFDVALEYADGEGPGGDGRMQRGQRLVLAGADFGVHDDFQLTPALATLLRRNRVLVEQRLSAVERSHLQHRDFFRHEADLKHRVLSHSFLLAVFAEDRLSAHELDLVLRESEHNPKVQSLVQTHKASIKRFEERMDAVTGDAVRGWWYLFFDDLWRRNHDVGLQEEAFSPHYSSSICYHPMSRPDLEAFLHARGFSTGRTGYFHTGFLNRLYFHLDEQVFSSTSRAIPIHLSSSPSQIPLTALSHSLSHAHASAPADERRAVSHGTTASRLTANTGGGTSEDDPSIRHRGAFLFEEVYERPASRWRRGGRVAWARFQLEVRAVAWAKRFLGLEPVVRDWRPAEDEGVVLDLRRGSRGWEVPKGKTNEEEVKVKKEVAKEEEVEETP
ncbi:hypothetical protein JCM10450v2_007595 [Rhodotorula kratochvilovae]